MKPSVASIHLELEKHIAVSDERWVETINRIKRIEHIMIGTAGTTIVLLISMIVKS